MNLPEITAKKIKDLKIQGARAIAAASLNCLKKYANGLKTAPPKIFNKKIRQAISSLKKSRPTEPLNQNFLNYLEKQLTGPENFIKSADRLTNLLSGAEKAIVKNGLGIIKYKQKILTHCHSSAVEAILKTAFKKKHFSVFNTETRPNYQGRITAKNLRLAGLPVTMVVDSAAPYLISPASGSKLMMDLIILGADAILPDGSVINKIGSFGIALAAKQSQTPLYIVATLLKYDADGIIDLEIRKTEEIWLKKPAGVKIINYAFDKIPATYITGIICEFGIIKPKAVRKLVKKHYPWIK